MTADVLQPLLKMKTMTVRTLLLSVAVVTALASHLPAQAVHTVPVSAVRSAIDSVRRERDAREAMLPG